MDTFTIVIPSFALKLTSQFVPGSCIFSSVSAKTLKNLKLFSIGDVLKPEKGFYSLTFENGPEPTYLWHSYADVVSKNLKSKKKDFDANGMAGYFDLYAAFQYNFDIVQVKDKLYVMYNVQEKLLHDIDPGWTWERLMKFNLEVEKQRAESDKEIKKANEKAFELLYKELAK
jgi:hypothetical protein